ncbi:MAG: hypothetical protein KDL87_17955 [Verrucomicrobiae bacterium]|nr:hypothetical protein [Verrucomicrobiae bacterium]
MNAATNEAVLQIWDDIKSGLTTRLEGEFEISQNSDARSDRFGIGGRSALVLHRKESTGPIGGCFEIWVERDAEGFGVGLVPRGYLEKGADFIDQAAARSEVVVRILPRMTSTNRQTDRFPLAWDDLMEGTHDKALADFMEAPQDSLDRMAETIKSYALRAEVACFDGTTG